MDSRPTTMASVGADSEATCQRDYQSEESLCQWIGHSLWKAMYGLVGLSREEIPQGNIVDIATGTGAWVKDAKATFHGREIWGIEVHAYDWRYSHSCSSQPTGTPKCECKLDLPIEENSTAFVSLRDTDL